MLRYFVRKLKDNRGNIGKLFGSSKKDNQVANISVPDFQTDTNYTNSQNTLANLGQNILSGQLPSFYSSLGQSNSPQFQSMINNVIGQSNQASQEAAAASGTDRSGVAQTASAIALGNIIPGLNYQDFMNAQSQKAGLLGTGINVEQNVGAMGQKQEDLVNQFALSQFNDKMQQAKYNNDFNAQAAQQKGQAMGQLFGVGMDVLAAPFTGGMSLAGIPSQLGMGSGMGVGTPGGSISSLLSGIGGMFNKSPSSTDIAGFGNMVGNAVGGGLLK